MHISEKGIELIKKFEGVRLTAYKCVNTEQYYTIGYGHYGADVVQNMTITQEQAETYLKSDLVKFEGYVNAVGLELNQNQFDALVSFTYNCGQGNLKKLIANRTLPQIANALLLYNKSGGIELPGLTTRRQAERALFLTSVINIPAQTVSATMAENTSSIDTFQVKITASSLRIRKGPGTSYTQVGSIRDKGVYTIVKTESNWGYLKSGAGWICLDYTKRL